MPTKGLLAGVGHDRKGGKAKRVMGTCPCGRNRRDHAAGSDSARVRLAAAR